ncbi:hypothetical protein SAMN02745216_03156 [Desulfatibacillum alkenivorans DSM 16219]|jgi:cephalosporin hydroxylase|uniref:Phasin protein n=1 Tax=Desulfatibacillum alkenivorans DSM 16219 TaxID=1121393 RepID=A0A1M6R056_9BACT|nr:hypothetical protein [Desulfatibacillum alkenivorans]SHK25862.1 hypothetical protein SAMN02745216_03156 [Desulfatibacillum alkenivorans DSM 16219]
MGNANQLNPQVNNALGVARDFTMCAKVVMVEGQGKAYQSAAQSVAIAVQDATDYLRNISTAAATAQGVAMAKILENVAEAGDYEPVFDKAKSMVEAAATLLTTVGNNGKTALSGFEPGNS